MDFFFCTSLYCHLLEIYGNVHIYNVYGVQDALLAVASLCHLPVVAIQEDESDSRKDFLEHPEDSGKRFMDF